MKGLALMLAFAPALALAEPRAANRGEAWVVVADEAQIADRPARLALHALAVAALRERGVVASNDYATRELDGAEADLCPPALENGVESIFVLRIEGRLADRIPISLGRLSTATCRVTATVSLQATGLREAKKVVPRLTAALLEKKRPEETARLDSVLQKEAEPQLRVPVEKAWTVGFSAPAGISGSFVR